MSSASPPRKPRPINITLMGRIIAEGSSSAKSSTRPDLPKCFGSPSIYNFPETAIVTATECDFLQLHTPKAVVDMIKYGTYDSTLAAFLNAGLPPSEDNRVVLREMFRKYLTQSDVGQRKGLVVPKKDAEEYFPNVKKCQEESMILRFLDRKTEKWLDLRYCYYRSSQSYVLTTGWCRFAKANSLKEKDLIKFYECATENGDCKERCIMIDIEGFGEKDFIGNEKKRPSRLREESMVVRKRQRSGGSKETDDRKKRVKLFGVLIG